LEGLDLLDKHMEVLGSEFVEHRTELAQHLRSLALFLAQFALLVAQMRWLPRILRLVQFNVHAQVQFDELAIGTRLRAAATRHLQNNSN
jgi:hypothetical protein